HRCADPHQLLPVDCVRKARVEDEGVDLELEPVAFDVSLAMREHFDPDPGHGAALAEFESRKQLLQRLELRSVTGPEAEGQSHGALILVFYRKDLAILARPKLVRIHSCKGAGDGVLRGPTQ